MSFLQFKRKIGRRIERMTLADDCCSAERFVLCETFLRSNFSVKLIRIVVRTKLRLLKN